MCDRHRPETQAASHGAVPPATGPGTPISGLGPNSLGTMGIGEGLAAKSDHRVPICATILGKSDPPHSRPRPEPRPDPDVPPVRSRDARKGSKPPSPDGAVVIAEDSRDSPTDSPKSWNRQSSATHYWVRISEQETEPMAGGSAGANLSNELNTLFRFGVVGDLSDGQLLQRFSRPGEGSTNGGVRR